MLGERPDNYEDQHAWFYHFRLCKSIDGIAPRMKKALDAAPDAAASRVILMAYSATLLDISMDLNTFAQQRNLVAYMRDLFDFEPQTLLYLNVSPMADMLEIPEERLRDILLQSGADIENDTITAIRVPPRRSIPPAPSGPAR